jgi:hypothetical protein
MSTIDYVRRLGYTNVQDYINIGPNKTVDETRLKTMLNFMSKNGWVILKNNEIEDYDFKARDLIKYVTNDKPEDGGIRNITYQNTGESDTVVYGSSANKFRSGGWIIAKDGQVIEGDKGKKYIMYKPHNLSQPPIPIQLENIKELYVFSADQLEELKSTRPVKFNKPGKVTNYPVYLLDKNGEKVVVYYAKDNSKKTKFINTKKFERAQKNGWEFN